jgi:glycosyltransferase involved in cell wall biosynthesis
MSRPSAPPRAGVAEPVLLDVTRLVARSWTGRRATGIDRVCLAYLRHFRDRAQAVVQHRGLIRALGPSESAELFALLEEDAPALRRRLARQLSAALLPRPLRGELTGRAYLNIGHTDFDLAVHHAWIRQRGVRPFYFLHDLIPVMHPEFSRPHAVRRHQGRVESALAHAAGIFLGSHAVERDLAGFAAARSMALPPLAVAPLAGEDFAASPLPPAPADPAPFFLTVGTIEPRKNHRLLLDVWQRLAARLGADTPRLVIVGQTGPMTGDLLAPLSADPALAAHVEHRSACCDTELASLMHHTRAVLMPSFAEGFGLPFVEALQAGRPVIASDLPVFREIGQGAASLIDPADRDGWEQAVLAALADQPRRTSGFAAPRWPDHFHVVERFIAAPAETTRLSSARLSSERVLAA